ncbi:hypothetical protein AAC387_Pa07g2306 [Persea americana]
MRRKKTEWVGKEEGWCWVAGWMVSEDRVEGLVELCYAKGGFGRQRVQAKDLVVDWEGMGVGWEEKGPGSGEETKGMGVGWPKMGGNCGNGGKLGGKGFWLGGN